MRGPLVFDPYSRDYKTISRFLCRDGVVTITKLCWRMYGLGTFSWRNL